MAMLLLFAVFVAAQVETLRGFLVVYLSALGAYYVAKQFGGISEKYWYRWRDPHPIVESLRLSKEKSLIEFYIRSKCTSPVVIESVFLRDVDDKIIPIESARVFQDDCQPDLDGWLRLKGYALRSRGLGALALRSERLSEVKTIRLLGKYANDEYWGVDQTI